MSLTNRTLPHAWAHKTKPSGKTGNGSIFFESDRIYSYGSHFLIATHVTNARGENAVLFTTANYSITTAGHKSRVLQSIPASLPVFHIDLSDFREVSPEIIDEYNERKEESLAKALRARVNRDWHLQDTQRIHAEALDFCTFFDYDRSLVTPLDGTVYAGCHVVKLDEIERIAPALEAVTVDA